MDKLTFDQLPQAVNAILEKLERIEKQLHDKAMSKDEVKDQMMTYMEISEEFKISIKTLKLLKKQDLLVPTCKGGRFLLFERKNVIKALQSRKRIKPKFLSNR